MISRRLNRKFKTLRNDSQSSIDPELAFCNSWVNHLVNLLKKHRGDKEFTDDVFFSAMEYFKNNMSEQEKLDVFAILLRKSVIGK